MHTYRTQWRFILTRYIVNQCKLEDNLHRFVDTYLSNSFKDFKNSVAWRAVSTFTKVLWSLELGKPSHPLAS